MPYGPCWMATLFFRERWEPPKLHYPAIDILHSVSRLTTEIATSEQLQSLRKLREALSSYQQAEDLIQLGAYVTGTNAKLDAVIRMRPELLRFLQAGCAR